MNTKPTVLSFLLFSIILLSSCGNDSPKPGTQTNDSTQKSMDTTKSIKEEAVTYTTADGTTLKGYVAYNENQSGNRPAILVVPEWWGLTEYPRMRAKMLAEMGYIAMAVDMYGDGKQAENPTEAQAAATPFYTDPNLGKTRLDAALTKLKAYTQTDTTQVAAIGYCFGGTMVLNYAKLGSPVVGVVSFHGGLEGVPPQKNTKAQFLICHGGADSFVPQPQVAAFKKSMDSAGVAYTFKVYENATHAFTNPKATEKGKEFKMPIEYNPAADSASWNDMKAFFAKIFRQSK